VTPTILTETILPEADDLKIQRPERALTLSPEFLRPDEIEAPEPPDLYRNAHR